MAPRYVALRDMDVKTLDESGVEVLDAQGAQTYRRVRRGEALPEARYWPTLRFWTTTGWVGLADHFVPDTPIAPGASDPDGPVVAAAAARRRERASAPPAATPS